MSWPLLKQLHVALAVLTALSFCMRAWWMLSDSALLHARWTRRLPHLVDTLLLATGIALAVQLSISPLAHPWLAAKLLAVAAYVVLGSIALKRGRSRRARVTALLFSLLLLAYIFSAALHHDPLAGLG